MDLALTSEEMKFRSDLQSWLSKFCQTVRLVEERIFSLNHAMIRSGGSKRLMKRLGRLIVAGRIWRHWLE